LRALWITTVGCGGSHQQTIGEKSDTRFVVADVRCPEFFDLRCVRAGVQSAPAIDAIRAIGKPDRGELLSTPVGMAARRNWRKLN
jgi:hypothetical protein